MVKMKNNKNKIILFLTLLGTVHCALFTDVRGDIHVSTSCDQGAVQFAIGAASDNDIVMVPRHGHLDNSFRKQARGAY